MKNKVQNLKSFRYLHSLVKNSKLRNNETFIYFQKLILGFKQFLKVILITLLLKVNHHDCYASIISLNYQAVEDKVKFLLTSHEFV